MSDRDSYSDQWSPGPRGGGDCAITTGEPRGLRRCAPAHWGTPQRLARSPRRTHSRARRAVTRRAEKCGPPRRRSDGVDRTAGGECAPNATAAASATGPLAARSSAAHPRADSETTRQVRAGGARSRQREDLFEHGEGGPERSGRGVRGRRDLRSWARSRSAAAAARGRRNVRSRYEATARVARSAAAAARGVGETYALGAVRYDAAAPAVAVAATTGRGRGVSVGQVSPVCGSISVVSSR